MANERDAVAKFLQNFNLATKPDAASVEPGASSQNVLHSAEHEQLLSLASRNDREGIEDLLNQQRADLDMKLICLALFLASSLGHDDVVHVLIAHNADSALQDSEGMHCLHRAVVNNHPRVVSLLLSNHIDVNIRNSKTGHTPWTLICGSSDHEEVAQLLINGGAKLNVHLIDGENQLYRAAAGGHVDRVSTMLKRGMSASFSTPSGWCPLHWGAANGHISIVRLLIEAGASVNCVSDTGETPLDLVDSKKKPELMEIRQYLIENGAKATFDTIQQQSLSPSRNFFTPFVTPYDMPPVTSFVTTKTTMAKQKYIYIMCVSQDHGANSEARPSCQFCRAYEDLQPFYSSWLPFLDCSPFSFVSARKPGDPQESPIDERYAYIVRELIEERNPTEDFKSEDSAVDNIVGESALQRISTYHIVRFFEGDGVQNDKTTQKPKLATVVDGPHGKYFIPFGLELMEKEDDGSLRKYTIQFKATTPCRHSATCDHCNNPILGVRYRCIDCTDYDLCHQCFHSPQAPHRNEDHHLESIYHPVRSDDWQLHPREYLKTNFERIAYRFQDEILKNLFQDPDNKYAIRRAVAAGAMFPWKPRIGIDPPYWVGNLDCTGKPAETGVPHIRCMGLRLQASDPVDAPPAIVPSGYRYFGQILLEAIGRIREHEVRKFEEDVFLMPREKYSHFAARFFEDRLKHLYPDEILEKNFHTFSITSLGLSHSSVQELHGDKEQGPKVALWRPVGKLAEEKAGFWLGPEDAKSIGQLSDSNHG